VVGALALPAAEVARLAGAWPINRDFYPPVVGPGDAARLYFPEKIASIKGYWTAVATAVRATNADRLGPAGGQLTAPSPEASRGSFLTAKSSEKDSRSTPWVDVRAPDDPSLAGKSADLEVGLMAQYPAVTGPRQFGTRESAFTRPARLAMAPPHAG